ncbi:alpha-L-fucosidase [Microbacterium maritypicum]|uniref:alpha-L-fucosidase n=1 Tax=Microbacterium maritypicum TaxID=33918 RepID=UPI0037FB35D7
MTDREWGFGHEDPSLFAPENVDTDQWMRVLKSGGMRGVILTAKHHDGFCLWPSALTDHTVASSPWRNGRGDLVRETADAAARHGLAFGVYLSPWDRTEATYGTGTPYDDFFLGQLTELLTNYGPISTVWLDGANGEGADGRVQQYDWLRYYELIRHHQPDAVISVCGPDVRWCGNEAGHTRADEWSVVPASLRDVERIASRSQSTDDSTFSRLVRSDEEDLGSRAMLEAVQDHLVWYPAEVNTSIRPGWFHHPAEDSEVRSADELFEIYRRSVGGNSGLLLNVPPDRTGRITPIDEAVLAELGQHIVGIDARDVAARATVHSSRGPEALPQKDAVWHADEGESLTLRWSDPLQIEGLVLEEDVEYGQQIDGLTIEVEDAHGVGDVLASVGSIGYRRIIDTDLRLVSAIRIRIDSARGRVRLSRVGVLAPVSDAQERRNQGS